MGIVLLLSGCGPQPPAKNSQQGSGSPPRIAPPTRRGDPIDEPEPEKPPPAPVAVKHPVGPWLEWRLQVAGLPAIEGKSYLKLIVTPGYDSALQLASYDSPDHEDFPSLFIRAVTPAKTLPELLNKKLPAQLYIMDEKDGNLIHNLPTQPAEIVISEIDGKNIRGTFSGQVHDVDRGGNAPIAGKFQATIE